MVALVTAGLFAAGSFVMASAANSVDSGKTIYACVTGVNGNIVRVSNTPHTCPKNTTPIYWNEQGIQGNAGPVGAVGPKGDPGLNASAANGLVAWYFANMWNEAAAIPVNSDSLPETPLTKVNIITHNMRASVIPASGGIGLPVERGGIATVFFIDDQCSVSPSSPVMQANDYGVLGNGKAYVGGTALSTLAQTHSVSSPTYLTNSIKEFLTGWGIDNGHEFSYPIFNSTQISLHCYSYTQADLEQYFSDFWDAAVLANTDPQEANQWAASKTQYMSDIMSTQLRLVDETAKLPALGELHVVSNF